jgi:UDP-N-acetylglucosamine--N-acetylmuramyl-(pentapeptide) pyrophosphoryl-undecaprenol N-acetylglucosamine transferase
MNSNPGTHTHVAIACGGTGGHLFPGLAVGRELGARGARVTLLISPKEVDQAAVRGLTGLQTATLPAVGLQGRNYGAFLLGFARAWQSARCSPGVNWVQRPSSMNPTPSPDAPTG